MESVDRLPNIKQSKQDTSRHSEHLHRFRFDRRSQHGVEAGARHDVDLCSENVADLIMNVDQIDQAEARVVGIEEQIDVAGRPRLIPCDRPEQVKPRDDLITWQRVSCTIC